jgi:ACR3 family arsenite transporter
MVLIWNELAGGDADYCAVLVAINSILQIVLFAPFSIFYLRIVSHDNDDSQIGYSVVARSVAVFLGMHSPEHLILAFCSSNTQEFHLPPPSSLV